MKLCWIASACSPYSDTQPSLMHGGATDYLRNMVSGMTARGHANTLLLPEGSDSSDLNFVFAGKSQPCLTKNTLQDSLSVTKTGESLSSMLDWAWHHQEQFDAIINVGHDWLPFYLIDKFETPLIALPNLCKTSDPLDSLIRTRSFQHPHRIVFFSLAQRDLIGNSQCQTISQAFEINAFPVARKLESNPMDYLLWAGRVTPKKGLEYAIQAAKAAGLKLRVAGHCSDPEYLSEMHSMYPNGFHYLDLLSRQDLYIEMSGARAFLQLQHNDWHEAFGRTTAESMLAGCPVVYFDSGANHELVQACSGGEMIYDISQATDAIRKVSNLDRRKIQESAQKRFSQEAVCEKFETMVEGVLEKELHHATEQIANTRKHTEHGYLANALH